MKCNIVCGESWAQHYIANRLLLKYSKILSGKLAIAITLGVLNIKSRSFTMQVNITNQLHINTETFRVVYIDLNGVERTVRITQAESNILLFLTNHTGEIISKNQLIDAGWKGRITGNNSLNVAIYNLRKCLLIDKNIQLENIPKLGYRLNVIEYPMPEGDEVSTEEEDTTYKNNYAEFVQRKYHYSVGTKIKAVIMIVFNLFLLNFVFTTYLNLVWVECKTNANGEICYSKSYPKDNKLILVPEGIAVISNNYYSTRKE
jgi:DNA-binding winged helix-turn-helix (wHTH) protein